jgi:hypothetical protein
MYQMSGKTSMPFGKQHPDIEAPDVYPDENMSAKCIEKK